MTKRPDYALVNMPDGTIARIPVETTDPFDRDEANEFRQTAQHRHHTNILTLLDTLQRDGLSPGQATGVVCQYLDLLEQRGQR